MSRPRVVVTGASIAGLSCAFWLRRAGWEVTVLERAGVFRDGGQNVDVRGVAREVLGRMGLFEAVKDRNTTETGTVLVDEHGRVRSELPSDGPNGSTAELEVLRGDLARTVLEALPDDVTVRYGEVVTVVQDHGAHVVVTTSTGETLESDLLVVAEGVSSSTRDLVFDDVELRPLDISMAFGTIPRTEDDDDRWRWFITTGGRQVHLRPDNEGTIRAILACARGDALADLPRDEVLERLRERYADAGWESGRVLEGFATTSDLYVDDLTQVYMDSWHRGRVVLAGDAGWCVTPMGGGGASLALTSGYVLAAQLSTGSVDDPAEALARYDAWMRPVVDDVQGFPPGVARLAYPETTVGLTVQRAVTKVATSPLLKRFTERISDVATTDQELPELREA